MGGFEGGDEGGFWDIDPLPGLIQKQNKNRTNEKSRKKPSIEINDASQSIKAHAKLTIFLKVRGDDNGHPNLLSRVIRLEELYDTISFVPCKCDTFTIEGCDDIPLESNSIYKAYKALYKYTNDPDIEEFFEEHKVIVNKRITSSVGLGGSASNAAAFIYLLKEVCNLILSRDELINIGNTIASDLAFFIYNYPSANVSGSGEIIEPFEEETLNVELYTSEIQCDEMLLYQTFKKDLFNNISLSLFEGWETLDSKSIIERMADPVTINDYYAAALIAYPELHKMAKEGWFFSGSTFFKPLN